MGQTILIQLGPNSTQVFIARTTWAVQHEEDKHRKAWTWSFIGQYVGPAEKALNLEAKQNQ